MRWRRGYGETLGRRVAAWTSRRAGEAPRRRVADTKRSSTRSGRRAPSTFSWCRASATAPREGVRWRFGSRAGRGARWWSTRRGNDGGPRGVKRGADEKGARYSILGLATRALLASSYPIKGYEYRVIFDRTPTGRTRSPPRSRGRPRGGDTRRTRVRSSGRLSSPCALSPARRGRDIEAASDVPECDATRPPSPSTPSPSSKVTPPEPWEIRADRGFEDAAGVRLKGRFPSASPSSPPPRRFGLVRPRRNRRPRRPLPRPSARKTNVSRRRLSV
mmetsp:Transcript_5631/g.23858  ORF Transcript_5631/g.23858 Transcript_5631/m.23858 type:complete len:275 (-) Transcript_5631:1666-2490(-)